MSNVAIKKITKEDEEIGLSEIEILNFLGVHDHITTMLESYAQGGHVFIVLPLCEGGDIVEYFNANKLTEPLMCEAIVGLLRAIDFCHS